MAIVGSYIYFWVFLDKLFESNYKMYFVKKFLSHLVPEAITKTHKLCSYRKRKYVLFDASCSLCVFSSYKIKNTEQDYVKQTNVFAVGWNWFHPRRPAS
jgi:hypothetical protein